jgi:two-component system chemotaxis response regulator CheY
MPQMGGIQTLQLLKRVDDKAKVIIVSSMADQSKIVECVRLGAVHYILKPFEEVAIKDMLKRFIFV